MTQTLDPSSTTAPASTASSATTASASPTSSAAERFASRVTRTVNTGAEEYRPGVVDRTIALGARALGLVPAALLRPLCPRNADGDRLDPDVALSLLSLKIIGGKDIADQDAVAARRNVDRQACIAGAGGPAAPQVGEVTEHRIAGVRVRDYRPEGEPATTGAHAAGSPVVLYVHGGGWVTGSLDSHDPTARYLCRNGQVRVISVDYRMAPEHPHPAPLDDVTAVVTAALDGRIPGVDPAKVVVAGDSAGGHLATATCLRLKQEGKTQPALQMLFVPVTDQRETAEVMASHRSRREFATGRYLTAAHMEWYDRRYLGDLDAEGRRDPLISPLLAGDLTGLAPAYVAVAGHDPLRDEGEDYAVRLAEAGVPVTVRRHRGLVHPFVNSPVIWRGSRRALDEAVEGLRAALSD